ncbi:hypothetical protein BX616_000375 [Lobosporangium transversale]|nr:hypothetical protein BX616_000375 [Lobosporangium transversale]
MGNQLSKRPNSKANRSSGIYDPNVHPLPNNTGSNGVGANGLKEKSKILNGRKSLEQQQQQQQQPSSTVPTSSIVPAPTVNHTSKSKTSGASGGVKTKEVKTETSAGKSAQGLSGQEQEDGHEQNQEQSQLSQEDTRSSWHQQQQEPQTQTLEQNQSNEQPSEQDHSNDNNNHNNHSNGDSALAAGISRDDTQLSPEHQQQPSPPKQQQPIIPQPSIPFAVSTPGNPILIKKHNLTPLALSSNPTSSLNRSSPPSLSPKFSGSGNRKLSVDLSPSARLSFLGPSSGGTGDKTKQGLDIDDMISRLLDAGYSGRISKGICLKNSEILYICQCAREVFLSQPTLIELNAPVKIVGDIHGQYTDMLRLFEMCGFPPSANFLFLGDYVDRGKMSLETILLLFCYKIKYPENFFLLRGNHECANVTRVYGFYDECKRRASIKMWRAFVDVFNCLPLAAIVANKIFCVHGGLSPNLSTMDDIRAIRRPTDVPDFGLLNDLLWSDPSDTAADWEDNERGVSYCFGRSIIQKFLNRHDFDLVCRAHMVVEDGYEFFNDRTLVTVFSAPNYCGEFDNYGAVMSVNEDLLCSFELLKPIDPETARAQMQSLAASAGGWRVNKQRLR